MNLTPSDEQRMMGDAADRLAGAMAEGSEPLRYWQELAQLGWLGLPFAEEYGGSAAGMQEIASLMRAFGKHRISQPYVTTVVLCGHLVQQLGTPAQRDLVLPRITAGELTLALAALEPQQGDQLRNPLTVARRGQCCWVLDGRKALSLGAPDAEMLLVTASIEGGGLGVFLVKKGTTGLSLKAHETVFGLPAADVHLQEVTVSADAILGDGDDASEALESAVDRAAAALCADAAGTMRWLLESTAEYLKTRSQFGRPLATFQALQHRLAEMAVACEESEGMALLALLGAEADTTKRVRAVCSAKLKIGKASRFVAQHAVQLHGAMGVTEELPIAAGFKRLMGFESLFGTTATQQDRYTALLKSNVATTSILSDGN